MNLFSVCQFFSLLFFLLACFLCSFFLSLCLSVSLSAVCLPCTVLPVNEANTRAPRGGSQSGTAVAAVAWPSVQ